MGFARLLTNSTFRKLVTPDGLPLFLLLVLGALVFGQVLSFDFVPYDDPVMVTGNGYVKDGFTPTTLKWAFFHTASGQEVAHSGVNNLWHPLTWLSHTFDATLFGVERATGHHLVSLAVHSLSGLLLYAIGRKLGLSAVWATLAAALFLVHPLHVEPVAWISSRKDVLCGFFVHAALLLGLWGRMRLATVAFAAALMAKPLAVVTPLLMLLLWAWPQGIAGRGVGWWRRRIFSIWHWWVLAALGAAAALYFQGAGSHAEFMAAQPLTARLLTMASGYLFLLWRSIWPADLAYHYPWPDAGLVWHLGAWGIVLAGSVLLFRFRARVPLLLWAFVWFTVCWLPISGLAYVGTSFTADRYTYLALTGFFLAISHALSALQKHATSRRWWPAMVGASLIAVAAGLAWKQTSVWKNGESLFRHAAKVQPKDTVAKMNMAGIFQQNRQYAEAIELYRQARAAGANLHLSHINEGNCLVELGKLTKAEQSFRAAVAASPNFSAGWRALGQLLARPDYPEHDKLAARKAFQKAWETSRESDPVALMFLVESHLMMGERSQAEALLPRLKQFAARDPRIEARMQQWR